VDAAFTAAAVALAWAALVAVLILRAARQYRQYEVLQPMPLTSPAPSVDVVVPARNEADAITGCLAGLAAQDYPGAALAVVVVDDGSTDGTAALARGLAAGDPRMTVIEAGALALGWTGKTQACWRGAAQGGGEWLCFIDADTTPRPELLRAAVAVARRRQLDLLSLEPRQELVSPWERLILPAGLCALGFVGDLSRTGDTAREEAPANGQFMLIRRSVYVRVGGHGAVRGTVAEDSALAACVKAAGGRVALMGGASLIGVRMYRSLPQLWEGIAKNVTQTFGGTRRTALIALAGPALAWATLLLPAALATSLPAASSLLALSAFAVACAASLALIALHLAAARYFAIPLWYGLLFPLGYTLAALLAAAGIAAHWRGHVAWKGRLYRSAADPGA
jgi:chlorobactene glucosyltransferase